MAQVTIGDYLLLRLKQLGVNHIFGVPGDYNLKFLDQIYGLDGIHWVGTCNELNASYAADGYARINGLAALLTTFGVGELSAINGVAGSYAEHVPVVAITGSPAIVTQKSGALVHHTLGTGDFSPFAQMYEKVTAAQAYLTPENAPVEIDRVLSICLLKKRPVYLSLPADVTLKEVAAPSEDLISPVPTSDPAALAEVVDAIATLLNQAAKPVILADVGVDRYHLQAELRELLAATGYPYATMSMGKGILEETHPQFIGIYDGAFSENYVRQRLEEADWVLSIGALMTDFNTGSFSARLDPSRTIELHGTYLKIRRALYADVAMRDVLLALSQRLKYRPAAELDIKSARQQLDSGFTTLFQPRPATPITQQRFWYRLAQFLKERDIVLAEAGTSLFGASMIPLPKQATFVGQVLWGSIGYTVGSLLGCAIAAPERRAILVVGDGSFQLAAQELSTLLRHRLKPIIFLINNDGYTVERVINGATMPYNDVQMWKYHQLHAIFGDGGWGIQVSTEEALEQALQQAEHKQDQLTFIEVVMDRMDCPDILLKTGQATAAMNQY
ncbi:MAG: alpha-keto acid decarboxylase family protein [Kovacikia sp.]